MSLLLPLRSKRLIAVTIVARTITKELLQECFLETLPIQSINGTITEEFFVLGRGGLNHYWRGHKGVATIFQKV